MKKTKRILSLVLSFSVLISAFSCCFTALAATQSEATMTGKSTSNSAEVAEFMMGDDLATQNNLLYGSTPRRVYTWCSSYSAEKEFVRYAKNTGSNGTNSYDITPYSQFLNLDRIYELTNGSINVEADNDIDLDNSIWASANAEHYLGIEWDLGSSITLESFYIFWSHRGEGDERIARGFNIYASDDLSTLYSSPVYSTVNNVHGMNRIDFADGTKARYFAIRITKCDTDTLTDYVYPRCREMALSGRRDSDTYAVKYGYSENIITDSTSVAHWMNGLPITDSSNILRGISPKITYTDSTGPTDVNSSRRTQISNGIFDDCYIPGVFKDDDFMRDSTYGDIIWDLGEERKFSELWLAFKERDYDLNDTFVAAKYAVYAGNDESTLLNSEPIITVDANAQNVNKIVFSSRTARYLALRLIVPNIKLWPGEVRYSVLEASLLGEFKTSSKISVVDEGDNSISIDIAGSDTQNYIGETVELSAPKTAVANGKAYIFQKFEQDGRTLESTLENGNYKVEYTVKKDSAVKVIYTTAALVNNYGIYIKDSVSKNIDSLMKTEIVTIGSKINVSSKLSYTDSYGTNYSLIGWNINNNFVNATADGKTSVTATERTEITAVYAYGYSGSDLCMVVFKSKNDEPIGTFFIQKGKTISSVVTDEVVASFDMPLIFGYTQTGWSTDLDSVCNSSITITPLYENNTDTYSVSVNGSEKTQARFDEKVTVNSTNEDFSSWKNGDSILSTDSSYTFYAPGKIDLTEYTYGKGTEVIDSVSINNSITWEKGNGYNLSVMASIHGISETDFIECGIIFADGVTYKSYGNAMNEKFILNSEYSVSKAASQYPSDGVYMITLAEIKKFNERAARAYVKYYSGGNIVTEYSRTAVSATKETSSVPTSKYANAATKYASHESIKLYGNNAIPSYNVNYASVSVSGSTESGNNPTIAPYIVDGADSCVIIYPGGGYFQRSDSSEGISIAKAYNDAGISAFVVRYRIGSTSGGYNDEAIITDGQRAVQFVRYHAAEFGINPSKIAVCGFSAGGHLAMSVSQNQMETNVVGDKIGELSNIPNATILGYAVTTLLNGTFSTMPAILGYGHTADEKVAINNKYSGELHATSSLAPTFIWHGNADTAVNPDYNSKAYYNALTAAGAVAEIHSYDNVGHGVGLAGGSNAAPWHAASVTFLKNKAGF